MHVTPCSSPNFGWNYKTHIEITEVALQNNDNLSKIEKRMLGRFSQMPDFNADELGDLNSSHFFFPFADKRSYTLKKNSGNNAMEKFVYHINNAFKELDREKFLREVGYAVHYLQDVSTPLHTEQGGIFQKFLKLPVHRKFERGKSIGASSRLSVLKGNYSPTKLRFANLERLFFDTAFYSCNPKNKVKIINLSKWAEIQQRCFNRGIDASREFFDYMLPFCPKK